MKTLFILMLLSQVPFPYDPNQCSDARIIRWYEGEPNKPIVFRFWVHDDDGDKIGKSNVVITGTEHIWLGTPVADPNGLLTKFSGDIKVFSEQVVYLKVYVDDRQSGDSRPVDNADLYAPKSDTAYILINVRRRNRAPILG